MHKRRPVSGYRQVKNKGDRQLKKINNIKVVY